MRRETQGRDPGHDKSHLYDPSHVGKSRRVKCREMWTALSIISHRQHAWKLTSSPLLTAAQNILVQTWTFYNKMEFHKSVINLEFHENKTEFNVLETEKFRIFKIKHNLTEFDVLKWNFAIMGIKGLIQNSKNSKNLKLDFPRHSSHMFKLNMKTQGQTNNSQHHWRNQITTFQ